MDLIKEKIVDTSTLSLTLSLNDIIVILVGATVAFGGILVAAMATTWKVKKFLDSKVNVSDFDGFKKYIALEFKEFKRELRNLSDKISKTGTVSSESPKQLNSVGREVAKTINADSMLDKYYNDLKKEVDESKPENEYDIHQASENAAFNIYERLSHDEKNIIKKAAYNSGVEIQGVLMVIAIMLRDKLLKESGIEISKQKSL